MVVHRALNVGYSIIPPCLIVLVTCDPNIYANVIIPLIATEINRFLSHLISFKIQTLHRGKRCKVIRICYCPATSRFVNTIQDIAIKIA